MSDASRLADQKARPVRSNRKLDRRLMIEFAIILRVSRRRIKRDRCGDWNIVARRGHIATDGRTFYAYFKARSARRWNAAKRALAFLLVCQDGDSEGIFKFKDTPTVERAAAIRKVLGLRKAIVLTELRKAAVTQRLILSRKNRTVSNVIIEDFEGVATTPPAGART